jgi:hypothetical protein
MSLEEVLANLVRIILFLGALSVIGRELTILGWKQEYSNYTKIVEDPLSSMELVWISLSKMFQIS